MHDKLYPTPLARRLLALAATREGSARTYIENAAHTFDEASRCAHDRRLTLHRYMLALEGARAIENELNQQQ